MAKPDEVAADVNQQVSVGVAVNTHATSLDEILALGIMLNIFEYVIQSLEAPNPTPPPRKLGFKIRPAPKDETKPQEPALPAKKLSFKISPADEITASPSTKVAGGEVISTRQTTRSIHIRPQVWRNEDGSVFTFADTATTSGPSRN